MTAPITLFTGLPGAGKTAQLVAEIIRLREAEPGRPIFAFGINGLREDLAAAITEEQLHNWWDLPPGSIICIDECQEDGSNPDQPVSLFPKDRGTPAPWVQRLAKVRHHGMSFLLTTQDPANMSAYVRRLVGRHIHTVNKFQSGMLQRFEWEKCMDDTDSRANRKRAVESMGKLPTQVFDAYKSSQIHTMKRRIPKKVYFFVVLVVVAICAVVAVPFVLKRAQQKNEAMIAGGSPGQQADRLSSAELANRTLRVGDYSKWITPRVAGIPWTAPAFDSLSVKAQPALYCIAVDDGRCSCVTEQGTRYDVPKPTCRAVAAGGIYNPFKAPADSQEDRQGDRSHRREAASPPAGGSGSLPAVVGVAGPHGDDRATAKAYTPPTFGPWNPHAL